MIWHQISLLLLKFTAGFTDGSQWKLAFNIHASDGHNFGYGAQAWEDENDVGSDATAFVADYKNYDVTIDIANFIAIVRHQDGLCEAARVWKFVNIGKTLHEYLDTDQTLRLKATYNHSIHSFISDSIKDKENDPIFSVDGGLVFNWHFGNNGVRIGNSKTWHKDGLPAEGDSQDDYHGIGNDFAGEPKRGIGSSSWWHDVSLKQAACHGSSCAVQGTDHGTSLSSGKLYGQYAIYISDEAEKIPCKDFRLQVSIYDPEIVDDFERIDQAETGYLNYEELVFDIADTNRDGVLSPQEYLKAREKHKLSETVTDADATTDFNRIDKDGDRLLNFDEVVFDIADTNKNGRISLEEYSLAREDNSLMETD